MNFDHENVTLRPRLNEDTVEFLDPAVPHILEVDTRGAWHLDDWVCAFPARVELHVDTPRLISKDRYGKAMRRKYAFSGDPSQIVRIPSIYRNALHQFQHGILVGGLLPHGRRVGALEPEMHPGFAAGLTGSRAPWAPPPASKSLAERAGPMTPEELDDALMRVVT